MIQQGIDVSRWQGKINWQQVQEDGVEFVMIRSSFGWMNYPGQVDPRLYDNVYEATAANIPYGFYHFSHASTREEAEHEADYCIRAIDSLDPLYPVAYDVENEAHESLPPSQLADLCIAFCERITIAGYYPAIYSSGEWWKTRLTDQRLNKYDKWVADYFAPAPSISGVYNMFQYSETGSVNGIAGDVDLDISYKDYPGMIRALDNNFIYTVSAGETLNEIAERFASDSTVLAIVNGLDSPYQTYAGQLIKIPTLLYNYFVQQGETLNGIADLFGVKSNVLAAYNNIPSTSRLKSGQVLKVPFKGQRITYTIKSKDTLGAIASRYNTTVFALSTLNAINIQNPLRIGQVLMIPVGSSPNSAAYTVKSGETLYEIAAKFNTTPSVLMSLNDLLKSAELQAGQVLLMP